MTRLSRGFAKRERRRQQGWAGFIKAISSGRRTKAVRILRQMRKIR